MCSWRRIYLVNQDLPVVDFSLVKLKNFSVEMCFYQGIFELLAIKIAQNIH